VRPLRRLTDRLSYANVVATLALFVALGGASYAAVELPAGSVGVRQLKPKAVTLEKLAFPLGIASLANARPIGLGKGGCDGEPLLPGEPAPPCKPVLGPDVGLRFDLRMASAGQVLLSGMLRLHDTQSPHAGEATVLVQPAATHSPVGYVRTPSNNKAVALGGGQTVEVPFEALVRLPAGRNLLGLRGEPEYPTREAGEIVLTPVSLVAIALPVLPAR